MKKWIAVFLSLVVLAVAGCGGDKPAVKEEKKVLKVATSPDFSPFEFMDEKGKIVGFDIDLMNAIGAKMGREVKVENISWDGLIPALQAGNVDVVIAGMSITPEREKAVLFSSVYYDSGIGILVKSGSGFKGIEDLKGKKIAVQMGTISQDIAEKIEGATVQKLSVSTDTFLELKINKWLWSARCCCKYHPKDKTCKSCFFYRTCLQPISHYKAFKTPFIF